MRQETQLDRIESCLDARERLFSVIQTIRQIEEQLHVAAAVSAADRSRIVFHDLFLMNARTKLDEKFTGRIVEFEFSLRSDEDVFAVIVWGVVAFVVGYLNIVGILNLNQMIVEAVVFLAERALNAGEIVRHSFGTGKPLRTLRTGQIVGFVPAEDVLRTDRAELPGRAVGEPVDDVEIVAAFLK